jgi:WD40 repeat protein
MTNKGWTKALCVSTSKPSSVVMMPGSNGGGAVTLVCPHSGSFLSTLRMSSDSTGKHPIGIASLSILPEPLSTPASTAALAFGSSNKADDTYALLLGFQSTSSSTPHVHWKCRLPEAHMTGGFIASHCGHYLFGGAASGTLYVWKSLGGHLVQSVKAHYRSITVLMLCGHSVVTGGADGMVHVYSLQDLVASATTTDAIHPIRTWSQHTLEVTALVSLTGGRLASGGADGRLLIVELCSGAVLATIHMPHGIQCLEAQGSRIYVGRVNGTVAIVDLDEYAMHQTEQLGAKVLASRIFNPHTELHSTAESRVFGGLQETTDSTSAAHKPPCYINELLGHEHSIASLVVWDDAGQEWLCTGDTGGIIRLWDLESRTCVRVIRPWSSSTAVEHSVETGKKKSKTALHHPVTSIRVMEFPNATTLSQTPTLGWGAGRDQQRAAGIISLVAPLQRFPMESSVPTPVPWLPAPRNTRFWDVSPEQVLYEQAYRKRKRNVQTIKSGTESLLALGSTSTTTTAETMRLQAEVHMLKSQLREAEGTISRWEIVNNKLMERLKK